MIITNINFIQKANYKDTYSKLMPTPYYTQVYRLAFRFSKRRLSFKALHILIYIINRSFIFQSKGDPMFDEILLSHVNILQLRSKHFIPQENAIQR